MILNKNCREAGAPPQQDTGTHLLVWHSSMVIGLSVGFMNFMGTHPSPHNGVTTLPTRMFLGIDRDFVSSTTTVEHGGAVDSAGSFPQTKCSCPGRSVTACFSLTVHTTSGISSPVHQWIPANIARKSSPPFLSVSVALKISFQ